MIAAVAFLATSIDAGRAGAQEQVAPGGSDPTFRVRPPPVNVDYLQFGVAMAATFMLAPGTSCPTDTQVPCILGSGGGLSARAGYRSRGPWYVGGAYGFAKINTNNLLPFGVLQHAAGELRYLFNLGQRTEPYLTGGAGGIAFGNEWDVETFGAMSFGGAGFEVQLSRTTVVGMAVTYRPMLLFAWTDQAGQARDTGLAHYWGMEVTMEAREAMASH